MGRVIFKKEKYEQHMINRIGPSEFLLLKLNSYEPWVDVLDGQDITDLITVSEQNGETIFHVKWHETKQFSFEASLYCFILPKWTEIIN
jgi:hypothetical protein